MYNLSLNTYLKIIFIISATALLSAYYIEYILGYQPCNLCIIERIPYGLGIVLIFLNSILRKKEKFFILLLILIFVFSFIVSIYHFGIEQGFFKESPICGLNNVEQILTKEKILEQLKEKSISCKDVTFRIFGFSLTTINILMSFLIFITLVKLFNNYEKFR